MDLLRNIPKIDVLCADAVFNCRRGTRLTSCARAVLDALRQDILSGKITELPSLSELVSRLDSALCAEMRPSLRPVLNATGIVLHTNLGRARLCESAVHAIQDVAAGYSTLEYDLAKGARGSRHSHVERLLQAVTGAEAAMTVNNNASAVLLALSALAKGGEVIISRGELVEIGGSFRVPEVMEQGGAILREVGTTNKTRMSDYRAAITESTAALLKVHTSNYRIVGFTEEATLAQLAALGKESDLPVIYDLGSGLLASPEAVGLQSEPWVLDSVSADADVITFSGDKLLGGPQAGIIIGKKKYIDALRAHPLARAMRTDKLSLAALEATLSEYLDPARALRQIPVLAMLSATSDELRAKADAMVLALKERGIVASVIEDAGQVGGGSAPTVKLPSLAVAIIPKAMSLEALEERLRLGETPVIGHISNDRFLLNTRTLLGDEPLQAVAMVARVLMEEAL